MLTPKPTDITRSTAMSAVEASLNCMAAIIVILSTTGRYELSQSLVRYCPVEDATLDGAVCC